MERINIREQAVEEIRAQARCLLFVKSAAVDQVLLSVIENLDSHDTLRQILAFAVSQFAYRAFPSATRF